jgi:hypothetical protein
VSAVDQSPRPIRDPGLSRVCTACLERQAHDAVHLDVQPGQGLDLPLTGDIFGLYRKQQKGAMNCGWCHFNCPVPLLLRTTAEAGDYTLVGRGHEWSVLD